MQGEWRGKCLKSTFPYPFFYISLFLRSCPHHYMDLHLTPDLTQHLSSSHCHTLSLSHMAASHVSRAPVCYIHTGEETERCAQSTKEHKHARHTHRHQTETKSEQAFNGRKSYCPWRSSQRENLIWGGFTSLDGWNRNDFICPSLKWLGFGLVQSVKTAWEALWVQFFN